MKKVVSAITIIGSICSIVGFTAGFFISKNIYYTETNAPNSPAVNNAGEMTII